LAEPNHKNLKKIKKILKIRFRFAKLLPFCRNHDFDKLKLQNIRLKKKRTVALAAASLL